MKKTAQYSGALTDPRARGCLQRKHLPRTALAEWSPILRKRTPAQLLDRAMRGHLPKLLELKRGRMCASPFAFFRGALPVMAYDLSLQPHTRIFVQLCGDAHVQNFGAFSAPDGALIFDLNDFDETVRGPFEWDVKRLAASILLAGDSARLRRRDSLNAAALFLGAYTAMLRQFTSMPILAVAHFQVHRLRGVQPVARILLKAERETPERSLERLTRATPHGRVFKSEPPLLMPVAERQSAKILAALKPYSASLRPERRHFFAQFSPVAVAFKAVGTGSLGLRDFCVYLEGNGSADPLFLQVKEETQSAIAPYLPHSDGAQLNQGRRVVEGQHAMQFQSDPLLGWTRIEGRDYLVRQLNDHKATINITTLSAADLATYSEVCGEILARSHARSGDSRVISGYIGKGTRFRQAILDYAQAYAAQTREDYEGYAGLHPPALLS